MSYDKNTFYLDRKYLNSCLFQVGFVMSGDARPNMQTICIIMCDTRLYSQSMQMSSF